MKKDNFKTEKDVLRFRQGKIVIIFNILPEEENKKFREYTFEVENDYLLTNYLLENTKKHVVKSKDIYFCKEGLFKLIRYKTKCDKENINNSYKDAKQALLGTTKYNLFAFIGRLGIIPTEAELNEIIRLVAEVKAKEYADALYKWQGEKISVRFGYCSVKLNNNNPLFWYNYFCANADNDVQIAKIPAIEVTCKDEVFCISNVHGEGHAKLINGGWPNMAHRSLPESTFYKNDILRVTNYDKDAYFADEEKIKNYQKENFPKEFAKSEALRMSITNKN